MARVTSANANSVGAFHFSNNPEIYEIQRGNNFEFIVTDLDNLRRAGTDGSESDSKLENPQEYLRLSVASASVPHYSQNAIEVKRGNTTIKYAGVMSFPSGSIEVYDFIGARTKDILMAWQNLSGDIKKETVGLQASYKKQCQLIEYSPDYNQKVRTWILEGCWVSNISEGNYDQNNNDSRRISATIEYDKAYVDTSELI